MYLRRVGQEQRTSLFLVGWFHGRVVIWRHTSPRWPAHNVQLATLLLLHQQKQETSVCHSTTLWVAKIILYSVWDIWRNIYGVLVECYWQGKVEVHGRNPLPMRATNFTRSDLGSKPVLRGKMPKTKRLNEHTNNTSNKNVKPARHASHSVFISRSNMFGFNTYPQESQ